MIDTSSRPLGSTHLTIGRLGLGVAPLGNLYSPLSDAQADETLSAAERLGIQWFDVAPYYGFGLAEARLGRFLQRSRGTRHLISTKVGRVLQPKRDRNAVEEIPRSTYGATWGSGGNPEKRQRRDAGQPVAAAPAHEQFVAAWPNQPVFDYSRAGIERAYADSLGRLGIGRAQILLLHDVDRLSHPHGHRSLVEGLLKEGLPTLHGMKADGAIDAVGLGVNEWDIGYEILASAAVDCVLLAGRYTLLDSSAFTSGFLDACARRNVSVLAGGVFNSGFLAGGSHFDYRPADAVKVAAREALAAICRRYDVELPAAALQFTAAHPAITSIVVGARSAEEIEAVVRWSRTEIPPALWSELRRANLIPAEAPS